MVYCVLGCCAIPASTLLIPAVEQESRCPASLAHKLLVIYCAQQAKYCIVLTIYSTYLHCSSFAGRVRTEACCSASDDIYPDGEGIAIDDRLLQNAHDTGGGVSTRSALACPLRCLPFFCNSWALLSQCLVRCCSSMSFGVHLIRCRRCHCSNLMLPTGIASARSSPP